MLYTIHGKCFSFPSPFLLVPTPLLPSLPSSFPPPTPLITLPPPFVSTPLSPTCKDFPSVNSVYRQQSPHTANNMDSLQREWFVFEHQLVLPEYIIHFQYSSTVRVNLASYPCSQWEPGYEARLTLLYQVILAVYHTLDQWPCSQALPIHKLQATESGLGSGNGLLDWNCLYKQMPTPT